MWFIRLTCYLIMTVRSPSVMYEASTKPLVDSVQGFHVQLVDFFDVAARGVGDGGGERGIGCELKVQVFGIQVFLSDFGRHATHLACCNGVPACFTSHSLNGTRLGQLRVTMSNPFVSRSASRPGRRRTTVRCRVHGTVSARDYGRER